MLPELWREEGVPLEAIRPERLQERFGNKIVVTTLPLEKAERRPPGGRQEERLAVRNFQGRIETDFAVKSFSSWARELSPGEGPWAGPAEATLPIHLRFPAGPEVGQFLHKLLESLDFQAITVEAVERLGLQLAPRFGLSPELPYDELARWLEEIVSTPILDGLVLKAIPKDKQLREWSFELATARVDPEKLTALLERLEGKSRRSKSKPSGEWCRGSPTSSLNGEGSSIWPTIRATSWDAL